MAKRLTAYELANVLSDAQAAARVSAVREAFGKLTAEEARVTLWLLQRDHQPQPKAKEKKGNG